MPTLPKTLSGTVNLGADTYIASGEISVAPGAVVTGNGSTVIKASSFIRAAGANVTFRNLTFDFSGFGLRRDGDFAELTIDNCIVRGARVGLEANGGSKITVRNTLFDRCQFTTWMADQANLLLENNEVTECGYGFKVFSGNAALAKSWAALNNWIHDCPNDFMAFEWQGVCQLWVLQGNLIERIRFGPQAHHNDHSLLMSVPMDRGVIGIIRNNAILGQKPKSANEPWTNGHPLLIEAGGDNTMIEGNILDGGGTAIGVTDKSGSCSVIIRNNRVANVWRVWSKDAASQVVTVQGQNDANTATPMTVDQIRAVAGRNKTQQPPPDPDPDPQPGPDPRDARIAELEQQRAQDLASIAEKDRRLNNAKAAGESVVKAVNGQ